MTGAGATVFVVDDDASVCRSVSRLLRTFGYHVETFSGARDFLDRAHPTAPEPACLLLDARMPELSGFDLLERLKTSGRNLPVVFITGHGDVAMAMRAMEAGAVDFLAKPFDEQALSAAVERAIAKARER